jgi:BirA family biotin operon repressor/biotin-[acetyl-CoA-carboxylase] ligase
MTGMSGPGAETERFGRRFRHYQVAISAGTQALAWARQEDAPAGAAVVVDQEISPLGHRSRMWPVPAAATLALAVVLRPPLSAEEGDLTWLMGGVAAAEGAEVVSGKKLATWWPDKIVDAETDEQVGVVKSEVQLGPGKVRSAVVTARLGLAPLGLGADRRDELLEAALLTMDRLSAGLEEEDGVAGAAAAYESRCALIGRRVKIRLLPKGETRGVAGGVDRTARLELKSPTGMVERITIDMVGELETL